MPYQIKKQVNGNKTVYKLYNIKKKEFVKINFKSKNEPWCCRDFKIRV